MSPPGPVTRVISPVYNATGVSAALGAIYACAVMVVNVAHHTAVVSPQVVIAAIGALLFLYSRFKVTPLADPKAADGTPLVPKPVP